jgi:hypothetical protein
MKVDMGGQIEFHNGLRDRLWRGYRALMGHISFDTCKDNLLYGLQDTIRNSLYQKLDEEVYEYTVRE